MNAIEQLVVMLTVAISASYLAWMGHGLVLVIPLMIMIWFVFE